MEPSSIHGENISKIPMKKSKRTESKFEESNILRKKKQDYREEVVQTYLSS
tara:strand:- start:207 stop:359 length:153 start_codon:yes stop_codon:yes gene_type:complete